MVRFLLGLATGLVGGFFGADYWLKRQEQNRREQEDLIEIDQIPLPDSHPARRHTCGTLPGMTKR